MTRTPPDETPLPPLSVAQAKANLRAQGEVVSAEFEALLVRAKADAFEIVDEASRSLKRTIPWAAAAAVGAGLMMGRGRARRRREAREAGESSAAGGREERRGGRGLEWLKWTATTVGPVVFDYLTRTKRGRSPRAGQ